jgi:hypothetical protein
MKPMATPPPGARCRDLRRDGAAFRLLPAARTGAILGLAITLGCSAHAQIISAQPAQSDAASLCSQAVAIEAMLAQMGKLRETSGLMLDQLSELVTGIEREIEACGTGGACEPLRRAQLAEQRSGLVAQRAEALRQLGLLKDKTREMEHVRDRAKAARGALSCSSEK